jgi:hypothetical protein
VMMSLLTFLKNYVIISKREEKCGIECLMGRL